MTKQLFRGLALAGLILAAAAAVRYARGNELIDADTARRASQVFAGLVLAVFANWMPKNSARSSCVGAGGRAQSALRAGGWAMALGGLAYAGLWAFAPLSVADSLATFAVVAAVIFTLAYGGWMLLGCRAGRSGATT